MHFLRILEKHVINDELYLPRPNISVNFVTKLTERNISLNVSQTKLKLVKIYNALV
jgi:hypothetical protein